MTATFDREVDVAVAAAREAMDVVMDVYSADFAVEYKDRREPVTLADRRANQLLCDRLAAAFPDDGIVAEESVPSDPAALVATLRRDRVWFVDPLDGTKEFVARNDEFSVMLGLCVAGLPVVGVVAMPVQRSIAFGAPSVGAWWIDAAGARERLQVSSLRTVAESSLLLSRSHRSERLLAIAAKLSPAHQVVSGSVGVKCVRIARGTEELYVNLPSRHGARLWDACGPEAIVRAAGGQVTTVFGDPIAYQGPELVLCRGMVATNGWIHDEVLRVTGELPA